MVNRKQTFGDHVGDPLLMRKIFKSRARFICPQNSTSILREHKCPEIGANSLGETRPDKLIGT